MWLPVSVRNACSWVRVSGVPCSGRTQPWPSRTAASLRWNTNVTFGRDTQPITVAIFSQLRQFGTNIELIAPASFVSLLVPLVVFFAFQRYFAQGLLAGSVK